VDIGRPLYPPIAHFQKYQQCHAQEVLATIYSGLCEMTAHPDLDSAILLQESPDCPARGAKAGGEATNNSSTFRFHTVHSTTDLSQRPVPLHHPRSAAIDRPAFIHAYAITVIHRSPHFPLDLWSFSLEPVDRISIDTRNPMVI
jgi:hypothetical protein